MARKSKKDYKGMDDEAMKKTMIELHTLPPHMVSNNELLKVFLPILRGDMTLDDEIIYDLPCRLQKKPLSCPFVILEAVEDIDYDIKAWSQLTSGGLTVKQLPGAHYYLKDPDNVVRVCDLINKDVAAFRT